MQSPQGINTGEFDQKLDPELAMDILYSPIYYRLLIEHLPLDEDFAVNIARKCAALLSSPMRCLCYYIWTDAKKLVQKPGFSKSPETRFLQETGFLNSLLFRIAISELRIYG